MCYGRVPYHTVRSTIYVVSAVQKLLHEGQVLHVNYRILFCLLLITTTVGDLLPLESCLLFQKGDCSVTTCLHVSVSRPKMISFFDAPSLPSCRMGHTDVLKYLCGEVQCNVNCTTKSGETPLHCACE